MLTTFNYVRDFVDLTAHQDTVWTRSAGQSLGSPANTQFPDRNVGLGNTKLRFYPVFRHTLAGYS